MRVHDVAGNRHGRYRYCSPHHRMTLDTRNEGSEYVPGIDDVADTICLS